MGTDYQRWTREIIIYEIKAKFYHYIIALELLLGYIVNEIEIFHRTMAGTGLIPWNIFFLYFLKRQLTSFVYNCKLKLR